MWHVRENSPILNLIGNRICESKKKSFLMDFLSENLVVSQILLTHTGHHQSRVR